MENDRHNLHLSIFYRPNFLNLINHCVSNEQMEKRYPWRHYEFTSPEINSLISSCSSQRGTSINQICMRFVNIFQNKWLRQEHGIPIYANRLTSSNLSTSCSLFSHFDLGATRIMCKYLLAIAAFST